MDGSVLEEKNSLKMLGLTFSSKLDWSSYIISLLLKVSPRNLEPWFILWSFFFLRLPYVSIKLHHTPMYGILLSCLSWCSCCYLESLDKLQKRICKTVGLSLAASLEPLAHCRSVAKLSLFYRYYSSRSSSEPAVLVQLPYFLGGQFVILIDFMTFLSP